MSQPGGPGPLRLLLHLAASWQRRPVHTPVAGSGYCSAPDERRRARRAVRAVLRDARHQSLICQSFSTCVLVVKAYLNVFWCLMALLRYRSAICRVTLAILLSIWVRRDGVFHSFFSLSVFCLICTFYTIFIIIWWRCVTYLYKFWKKTVLSKFPVQISYRFREATEQSSKSNHSI